MSITIEDFASNRFRYGKIVYRHDEGEESTFIVRDDEKDLYKIVKRRGKTIYIYYWDGSEWWLWQG